MAISLDFFPPIRAYWSIAQHSFNFCVCCFFFYLDLENLPTEVPFYDYLGNIYIQTDAKSMGSIQGSIFSNFYMSYIENRIFNNIKKPSINLRYVDDILILANDINEINIIRDTFQKILFLNLPID